MMKVMKRHVYFSLLLVLVPTIRSIGKCLVSEGFHQSEVEEVWQDMDRGPLHRRPRLTSKRTSVLVLLFGWADELKSVWNRIQRNILPIAIAARTERLWRERQLRSHPRRDKIVAAVIMALGMSVSGSQHMY